MVRSSPWRLQPPSLVDSYCLLCHIVWSLQLWPLCVLPLCAGPFAKTTITDELQLPTIINDLNITSNPNQTQLWSVIPYAVATPVTGLCCPHPPLEFRLVQLIANTHAVLIAFLSDRLKLRGIMMLFTLPIAIIGYAVIANVASAQVRFAMTCLMAIGMYSSVPCVLVWNSNNSAGHYKRATTSALQLAIANAGGFVASKCLYVSGLSWCINRHRF